MIDLASLRPLFTILHLFGFGLGAGAGFVVDALFFSSLYQRKITFERVKTIGFGSKMVWVGIAVILASGLLLFAIDPTRLLASPKFLAKVTVVAVLIINGAIFHFFHYPRLLKNADRFFLSSQEFLSASLGLFISGALSAPSWLTALTLGVLRRLTYSYWFYIGIYAAVILGGVVFALTLRQFLASQLPSSNPLKAKNAFAVK